MSGSIHIIFTSRGDFRTMLRSRPAPEGSIDERLAKLEAELGERPPAERGPDPSVVRVTTLMDGLDDLASRLDDF